MIRELVSNLSRSFKVMTPVEKRWLILLLGVSIINGVIQTLGLVSIMPFIALISDPSIADSNTVFIIFKRLMDIETHSEMLFAAAMLSFVMLVVSNGIIVINYGLNLYFFNGRGHTLSSQLLKAFLDKSPSNFYKYSTSDLSKMIFSDVDRVLLGSQLACLSIVADIVTLTIILSLLVYVNPVATAFTIISLLIGVGLIYGLLSKRINQLGSLFDTDEKAVFSALKQALNLYKEIRIYGKESFFVNRFKFPVKTLYENSTRYHLLQFVPIQIIELLVFSIILILASYLSLNSPNVGGTITNIALYSFAAYKIIPLFKSLFESGEELIYAAPVLGSIQDEFNDNNTENYAVKDIKFEKSIRFNNVSFKFANMDYYLLSGLDLLIPAGGLTCICGPSGSGKSTCLDLMVGVISVDQGEITIDDETLDESTMRSWQDQVGYVPQRILMLDDTIERNVAFGVDDDFIDTERIQYACHVAQISQKIESLPDRYKCIIGDGGLRLSGGEQQRIAIARALYHQPKCLIFDEASNELDAQTEMELMLALKSLGLTIVFVSHKPSIIDLADQVIELKNNQLGLN